MKNKFYLFLLFLSHIVSGISSGITMISIPWYFTDSLNLNSSFSFMFGIVTFLGLFWGLYSGTLIDKYNRRKILELINLFSGLLIISIGFLLTFFQINKDFSILLIGAVFAITCFYYIIYYPTLYALIQEISKKKNYIKMNSYMEIVGQSTTVFAGALAAILLSGINLYGLQIDPWSMEKILILDGTTYLLGSLIISFINYTPKNLKSFRNKPIFSRLKIGFNFLKYKKLILIYGVCSHIIFAFLLVELFTLLPILIKNFFSKGAYLFAITDVCYAVGALFSGFFIYKWVKYYNKIQLTIILILLTSLSIIILISNKYILSLLFISIFLGTANSGVRILRNSFLFDNVPNKYMGRVSSIFNSINTIIRMVLIFIFSFKHFSKGENVIDGYIICAIILITFCLPIVYYYKKLKRDCIV